jgi:hypothetical protein
MDNFMLFMIIYCIASAEPIYISNLLSSFMAEEESILSSEAYQDNTIRSPLSFLDFRGSISIDLKRLN